MRELIDKLNYYTKLYDEGHPAISDKEWDELYFKLAAKEKETGIVYNDSPTQNISFTVVTKLNKVKHNHLMLSADKTKDWNEFLRYFDGKDVIGMLKLDGLTCSLRYLNGKLVSAETRGNGIEGEDITHNALVVANIPHTIPYNEELIIDGEVICTYSNFEPFSSEYKNPRNFASGSIRLLDSKECASRNLSFIVWNVIKGFDNENSFLNRLNKIDDLGFDVVPWTSSFDWDAKEFLVNQAKELGYPIDGLVGRFDDIKYGESLGATDHHTKAIYAFKFYDELYPTILKDVEWSMGRTGVLTPIALLEPVEIDGTVVERASLHNLSIMEELFPTEWRSGYTAYVYKANAIIPQIDEIIIGENKNGNRIMIPDKCPICGEPTHIITSESGTKNLVCTNPECGGKLINILDYFCGKKGLDIKGLSKMTLNKLIDWGWVTSREDIFNLKSHKKEWINREGFGEKSVENILSAIEASKTCELYKFISSLGIPLVGTNTSKDLCNHFSTWNEFRTAIDNKYHFYDLENFGLETHNSLINYDYTFADKIVSLFTFVENNDINVSNSVQNLSFCITGKLSKRRADIEKDIISCGGKMSSSVSSKTSYLVCNAKEDTTKYKNALKYNTKIITENQLYKILGLTN